MDHQVELNNPYILIMEIMNGLSSIKCHQKEHCLGLSYVAISRVKTLSGSLFESAFDFDRFKHMDSIKRDRDLDYSYRTKDFYRP